MPAISLGRYIYTYPTALTEMDRNSMNSKSFISTLDSLIFENFFEKKNHFDHRTFLTCWLIINHFDQEH